MPKTFQKEKAGEIEIKKDFSKYRDIEEELKSIQEKLRELNS
ncbi:MAG: hypothetical protein ABIF18_04175 [archaeon]